MSIKQKLKSNVEALLKDFLERENNKYNKYYTGKVIDNNDPDKKFRCKIKIYGIFDEIPDEDLPWCMGEQNFIGSKIGNVIIPPIDAIVRVRFEDNDIYNPVYTTKVYDANNLSEEALEDYPNTLLFFETDAGDYFKINKKLHNVTFHSASGVLSTIDKDGNIELNTEDTETGDVVIKDKHGNTFEMDADGVKINDDYIVMKKFLDDFLQKFSATLGLGNIGAPVPIFPATLTQMLVEYNAGNSYATNKVV